MNSAASKGNSSQVASSAQPVGSSSQAAGSGQKVGSGQSANPDRYPLQLKSLREMGFSDVTANVAALNTSKGNLQEAVEALLAGKRGSPIDQTRQPPPKPTSPVDDLVGVFGAMEPPSSERAPQSTSILDLDFPPPPTVSQTSIENGVSAEAGEFEEFEEFESATASQTIKQPIKRASITEEEAPKHTPPLKTIPSVAPDLSNPWASGASDAFDDIDPFRGFTSSAK